MALQYHVAPIVLLPGDPGRVEVVARLWDEAHRVASNVWQRAYHDRIICDDDDLERVREYIASNPARWAVDPENLSRRPRGEARIRRPRRV